MGYLVGLGVGVANLAGGSVWIDEGFKVGPELGRELGSEVGSELGSEVGSELG